MFAALGRVVINNPWKVIAAWVVAAVVVLAFSPQIVSVTSNNNSNFLPSGYESIKAQNVANKYFPQQSGATGSLVISTAKNQVLSSANESTISGLVASLNNAHIPSVTGLQTSPQPFPSGGLAPNGKVQLINVAFTGQPGGKLKDLANHCFQAPSSNTGRIQEVHITVWHAVCEAVEQELFG